MENKKVKRMKGRNGEEMGWDEMKVMGGKGKRKMKEMKEENERKRRRERKGR